MQNRQCDKAKKYIWIAYVLAYFFFWICLELDFDPFPIFPKKEGTYYIVPWLAIFYFIYGIFFGVLYKLKKEQSASEKNAFLPVVIYGLTSGVLFAGTFLMSAKFFIIVSITYMVFFPAAALYYAITFVFKER
ncbi:MAG: hypothetical protein AB7F28_02840 [Candidatus Margulisiibacteriota bacterium]